jgi:hypothetical protein
MPSELLAADVSKIEQNLEDVRARALFEGPVDLSKRIGLRDQTTHRYGLRGQSLECGLEIAATGSHQAKLVDHDLRSLHAGRPMARGLEDDGASRSRPSPCSLDPFRRSGRFHDPRIDRSGSALNDRKLQRSKQRQLLLVLSRHFYLGAPHSKPESDESAQPAIAKYQDVLPGLDARFPHSEGRGQRLYPNRFFVGNGIWHAMQILDGCGQKLRERAAPPLDAEDLSIRAMPVEPPGTKRASPAANVDLRDHTRSDPGRIGSLLDDPYHLVTRNAMEGSVAGEELVIGAADPGHENPHQGFPRSRHRGRDFCQPARLIENEGQHEPSARLRSLPLAFPC